MKIFFSGKVIKLIKKLQLNVDERYREKSEEFKNKTQNISQLSSNTRNNLYHYFGSVSFENDEKSIHSKKNKGGNAAAADDDDEDEEEEIGDNNTIGEAEDTLTIDQKDELNGDDNTSIANTTTANPNDSLRRSIIDQYTTSTTSSPLQKSKLISGNSQDIFLLPEYIERIFDESLPHPSLASFSLKYLQIIREIYQKILLSWEISLIREDIERLIEYMHSLSSNELWKQMISVKNNGITIFQQLEFMRNTYLLGKGEFYQVFYFFHFILFLNFNY